MTYLLTEQQPSIWKQSDLVKTGKNWVCWLSCMGTLWICTFTNYSLWMCENEILQNHVKTLWLSWFKQVGFLYEDIHPWKRTCPLKIGLPNRKVVFQPPFFRGELLNFGRVLLHGLFGSSYWLLVSSGFRSEQMNFHLKRQQHRFLANPGCEALDLLVNYFKNPFELQFHGTWYMTPLKARPQVT